VSARTRRCIGRSPSLASVVLGWSPWPMLVRLNPPNRRGTDPYARWCGRGGVARCPPIPIDRCCARRRRTTQVGAEKRATGRTEKHSKRGQFLVSPGGQFPMSLDGRWPVIMRRAELGIHLPKRAFQCAVKNGDTRVKEWLYRPPIPAHLLLLVMRRAKHRNIIYNVGAINV
jgi:hypothetical protein